MDILPPWQLLLATITKKITSLSPHTGTITLIVSPPLRQNGHMSNFFAQPSQATIWPHSRQQISRGFVVQTMQTAILGP